MSSVIDKASSVWEFVKRNRGKIIVSGIVVGTATYVGQKYLKNSHLWHQLESPFSSHALSLESRKHYVFDSNQRTCDNSVLQLIPSLKSKFEKTFDIEILLETLKNEISNSDKIQIWNAIKILSFSRLFASFYSYTLLIVSLKVQISIIAANIYAKSQENSTPNTNFVSKVLVTLLGGDSSGSGSTHQQETAAIDASTQQIFLQALHYFITQGSTLLTDKIGATVNDIMNNISLKNEYSYDGFCRLFTDIRSKIESTNEWPNYSNFVVPLSANVKSGAVNLSNSPQLDELLILLKSTLDNVQCKEVISYCLDEFVKSGFEFLRRNWPSTNSNSNSLQTNPLAKLIPVVSDCFHAVSQTTFDSVVPNLLNSSPVHEFAVRVFNKDINL